MVVLGVWIRAVSEVDILSGVARVRPGGKKSVMDLCLMIVDPWGATLVLLRRKANLLVEVEVDRRALVFG